jgi:single-strand DNA-binding protein
MEAQVALSGYVGSEVEFVEGKGYCYARFRLGCTPRVRKGDGWADADTTWIGVSVSRRTAQHVKQSIHTGEPVVVVGRLRTRKWQDGQRQWHETLQVQATSLGHDLAVGFSKYTRPERSEAPIEDEAAQWAIDNMPAEQAIDPETGEILDQADFEARLAEAPCFEPLPTTLDDVISDTNDDEDVPLAA